LVRLLHYFYDPDKIFIADKYMPIIPTSDYKNYKGAYGKNLEIRA
jgi:hypothetical protein